MISECSETMLVGIVDSATVYPSEKKNPLTWSQTVPEQQGNSWFAPHTSVDLGNKRSGSPDKI